MIPKDPKYKCKLKYKITSLLEPFCVQILWLWTRSLVDALDPWMEWNFFQKSEIPWPKKIIQKTCIFLLSCHYRGDSVLENWCHFRKKCHFIKIGTKQVLRGLTWNSWVVFLRGSFRYSFQFAQPGVRETKSNILDFFWSHLLSHESRVWFINFFGRWCHPSTSSYWVAYSNCKNNHFTALNNA